VHTEDAINKRHPLNAAIKALGVSRGIGSTE